MNTSRNFAAFAAAFALTLVLSPTGTALAAGGLVTGNTVQPQSSPNSGRTSGGTNSGNSGNINAQILMNTLNALSKQQNTDSSSGSSYQAPATQPVQQTYRPPVAEKEVLVTDAGYNCEDSLREYIARENPGFNAEQSATVARSVWENEYQRIKTDDAAALRKEIARTKTVIPERCLSGALAARLQQLGWSPQTVETVHKSKFDDIAARSVSEFGNGGGKRRLVLKQYPNCLKVVDVRLDHDVKDMYWYNIANTCGESVQAHWCEGKGCKPTDRAADIRAGGTEESWMAARTRADVRFRGTACALQYQGHDVQYDKTRNECWVWSE